MILPQQQFTNTPIQENVAKDRFPENTTLRNEMLKKGWDVSTAEGMATQLSRSFKSNILQAQMDDVYRTMQLDKQLQQNNILMQQVKDAQPSDFAELLGYIGVGASVGKSVLNVASAFGGKK